MAEIPRGMKVRIDGLKPSADDPYRQAEPDHGRLVIEYRFREAGKLAFDAILCVGTWLVTAGLFPAAWLGRKLDLFSLVIWIFLFPAALGFTYRLARRMINGTTIIVDAQRLVIRHGPIPRSTNREIPCDDLDALQCQKTESVEYGERRYSFALVAQLRSGEVVELIAGFAALEPCVFAGEQIDAYLERTETEHEQA